MKSFGLLLFTALAAAEWKGKYRIGRDGSKIALPSKEQLAFQEREIGVLIHFNIATFISDDGCNKDPDLVPDRGLFNPELLNIDQWMDTVSALGGKYATLVAKHNCGFNLWPSKTHFDLRDGKKTQYNYTVRESPEHADVLRKFVNSAQKYNVGHGFYYSSVVNNYLNVQAGKVRDTLAPGQVPISNSTYDQIVLSQLNELWTNYGSLTEIWFDGGYSGSTKSSIEELLKKTQNQAVIFNGCDEKGTCLSDKPIRWVGNEMGLAPEENWSTGLTNDGGDPHSPFFCPSECDTTLQTQDRWFFGVDQPLRSFKEMVDVYHTSVGRNCILALDLAPDRNGLIPANHAARYKQLGDFIKSCYGKPISGNSHPGVDGTYKIGFHRPTSIDRVSLMENQTNGQVIRKYTVTGKRLDGKWIELSKGTSVGHKKIDIFDPVTVTEIKVDAEGADTPRWRAVTAHLCDQVTAKMIQQAEAAN